MRHFTISKKGRKGYMFETHAYRYTMTIEYSNSFEEFDIYADSRKAAIESGNIIIASDNIKTAVEIQNAKQQLNLAKRLLVNNTTNYTVEQITDYINRINVRYGFETVETVEPAQVEVSETSVNTEQNETTEDVAINNATNENVTTKNEKTYTAYNRSFSSYELAYNYCIESDFDPEHITNEEPLQASQTSIVEPEPTEAPEVFYLYSNTFTTYWDAYNYAIKNRIDSMDMIISSRASISNEQLLKLKKEFITSKTTMSYDDVTTYYNHLLTVRNNKVVENMLYSLKTLKQRHESRMQAEQQREAEQIKAAQALETLIHDMYAKGMSKKENGYSTKYYISEECVYTQFGSIKVLDLYNDLLQVYNSHFEIVPA